MYSAVQEPTLGEKEFNRNTYLKEFLTSCQRFLNMSNQFFLKHSKYFDPHKNKVNELKSKNGLPTCYSHYLRHMTYKYNDYFYERLKGASTNNKGFFDKNRDPRQYNMEYYLGTFDYSHLFRTTWDFLFTPEFCRELNEISETHFIDIMREIFDMVRGCSFSKVKYIQKYNRYMCSFSISNSQFTLLVMIHPMRYPIFTNNQLTNDYMKRTMKICSYIYCQKIVFYNFSFKHKQKNIIEKENQYIEKIKMRSDVFYIFLNPPFSFESKLEKKFTKNPKDPFSQICLMDRYRIEEKLYYPVFNDKVIISLNFSEFYQYIFDEPSRCWITPSIHYVDLESEEEKEQKRIKLIVI